ncbi:glycerol-3-phosphate 1-O-acyltransferase PlsY, partial [bacterium]|nr:glycerol-3-phosphate 1-O-acyltransferase PlsY [bacterium]
IRNIGSGSTGATNVKRVLGKKWFFTVMILDALKGALPVILAKVLTVDEIGLYGVICAIFVILGHSKPVFLQFKGGKSVASGVGTLIALSPVVGLLTALIWAIITYISKYVSLGSIVAISLSPILMYVFKMPIFYTIYCLIAAIYIIYLHRENIKRLIKGEENKVR